MEEPMYLTVHETEDVLKIFDDYIEANSDDVDAQSHASKLKSLFVKECPMYVSRTLIKVQS